MNPSESASVNSSVNPAANPAAIPAAMAEQLASLQVGHQDQMDLLETQKLLEYAYERLGAVLGP